jgi:hypothetical protein
MKALKLIAALALLPVLSWGQVYYIKLDTQHPDWSLPPLTFLEGGNPTVRGYTEQDGERYTDITNHSAKFYYGTDITVTNSTFPVIVTNTTVNTTYGYFDIPFSSAQTGTNGTYAYTVYWFDENQNIHYSGTGKLTITETTWTGYVATNAFGAIINWGYYDYLQTATEGPYRAGTGVTFSANADGSQQINSPSATAGTNISISGVAQIDLVSTPTNISTLQFSGGTGTQGTVSWNADEETLDLIQDGATLQLGQEFHYHVRNATANTITNGKVVYSSGTIGASGRITVDLFIADGTIAPMFLLGVATTDIEPGGDGKVTSEGKVRGIDLSGYSDGDVLYPSATQRGEFTTTPPAEPNIRTPLGYVIDGGANGTLQVRVHPEDENKQTASYTLLSALPTTRPTFAYATDGTTVTGIVDVTTGSTHDVYFEETLYQFAMPTNIVLANGTTNAATYNYIIARTNGISAVSSLPTGEYAVLFDVGLLDAAKTLTDGPWSVRRWSDIISGPGEDDDRSLVQRVAMRLRREPARHESGTALGTYTNVNGGANDDVLITAGSGEAWQLHPQTLTAITNVDFSVEYDVLNDPDTGGIRHITNLNQIAKDSQGNAVLDNNNSYFNVMAVRHVNSGTTNAVDFELGLVLDDTDHATANIAASAARRMGASVDAELVGSTIPIGVVTLRRTTGGGGTWTATVTDRRGSVVNEAGGGSVSPTTVTEFSDAQFAVYNASDATKVINLDASGITTATTRTYTGPDGNGTLVISPGVSDLEMSDYDILSVKQIFGTNDFTAMDASERTLYDKTGAQVSLDADNLWLTGGVWKASSGMNFNAGNLTNTGSIFPSANLTDSIGDLFGIYAEGFFSNVYSVVLFSTTANISDTLTLDGSIMPASATVLQPTASNETAISVVNGFEYTVFLYNTTYVTNKAKLGP